MSNDRKPDHVYITLENGKNVLYDVATDTFDVISGNDTTINLNERQELQNKLIDTLAELEISKAVSRKEHPRFREITEDWKYSKDDEELAHLDRNPMYFIEQFDRAVEEYGPTDEEAVESAKDREKAEKRFRSLEKQIKAADKAGHSSTDLLDEWMQLKGMYGFFPEMDL